MSKVIRVLIADDSAFMRKVLSDLFGKQPDFDVAGTAMNGKDAISKVKQLKPDLLTMDVNMPVMDGLNALAVIMEECPLPVVMLSSLTQEGTDATVKALSLGAVDFISKAGGSISRIDTIESEILQKCRDAAQAHVHKTLTMPGPVKGKSAASDVPVMKHVELTKRQGLKLGGAVTTPSVSQPVSSGGIGSRRNNPLLQNRKVQLTPTAKGTASEQYGNWQRQAGGNRDIDRRPPGLAECDYALARKSSLRCRRGSAYAGRIYQGIGGPVEFYFADLG